MKNLIASVFTLLMLPFISTAATATFNYTFNNPVCASSTATNCINGFAVGTVSGGIFTQIAACPLPPTTTGTVNGITCNFTGTVPLGPITFAVVTLAVTSTGNVQSPLGASNETAVTVVPSSPSGVVVIFP